MELSEAGTSKPSVRVEILSGSRALRSKLMGVLNALSEAEQAFPTRTRFGQGPFVTAVEVIQRSRAGVVPSECITQSLDLHATIVPPSTEKQRPSPFAQSAFSWMRPHA